MTNHHPVFSIVIPTYNRPERLANCLQAIAQLDYPRDRFEVVVVDDGSEPAIEPVTMSFRSQLNLTVLRQANSGPAKARNTGATQAQGKYVVFTDDDCQPAIDWLKCLEAHFTNSPDSLVGGYTNNALPKNLYSTASQILIDYLYSYYNLTEDRAGFFASNNFAMPRELFHKIGGFDTNFPLAAGEDREFCDRWQYHNYSMRYAPDVQIHHAHKLSLKTFWRQHFNYGRGAFCFHQIRADRVNKQIKVEPFTFYTKLLTFPFTKPSSQPAILLTALLFLSQVANVAGFFWERSQASTKQPGNQHPVSLS